MGGGGGGGLEGLMEVDALFREVGRGSEVRRGLGIGGGGSRGGSGRCIFCRLEDC